MNENILNDMEDLYAAQQRYGGKKRGDLKDSDFLFPETRSFPIVRKTRTQEVLKKTSLVAIIV
jgi:hypothetical protein